MQILDTFSGFQNDDKGKATSSLSSTNDGAYIACGHRNGFMSLWREKSEAFKKKEINYDFINKFEIFPKEFDSLTSKYIDSSVNTVRKCHIIFF